MEIGHEIAKLRSERKLSQKELAEALNVSAGTVGMWETNKRLPSLECFVDIIDFFAIDADSLLSNDRKNKPSVRNDKNDSYENSPEYIDLGEAFKELNKDNKFIVIGDAVKQSKQLLKEQRLEEKRRVLPEDEAM